MVALTEGRNTPEKIGEMREEPVAAGERIFPGGIVMRAPSGLIVNGRAGATLVALGRSEQLVDNRDGADGETRVAYKAGRFRFENSSGADEITAANIGELAYVVDDQTVALTDGAGTRGRAGFIHEIDAVGVWIRFDEALTSAA